MYGTKLCTCHLTFLFNVYKLFFIFVTCVLLFNVLNFDVNVFCIYGEYLSEYSVVFSIKQFHTIAAAIGFLFLPVSDIV